MENGAKLNVLLGPGLKGDAPVCMAASRGFVPVIQELINRGASAREVDSGGWQPLRHAAFMGHVSAVGCLLGNGARAIDLGPLDNLSFSSTASLDQMARIRELLDSAVRSEQLEYQHVTYLASSATPANADGPVELQSASRARREQGRNTLLEDYVAPVHERPSEARNQTRTPLRNPELQPQYWGRAPQMTSPSMDSYNPYRPDVSDVLNLTSSDEIIVPQTPEAHIPLVSQLHESVLSYYREGNISELA